MFITVANYKGGVGKTTTAVHIATYLSQKAKTLLIDGDPNRSSSGWAQRGDLPFTIMDERSAPMHSSKFEHVVIDTQARPDQTDFKALADGCNLLILPTTPDTLALEALMQTVNSLRELDNEKFKVLLTIVPPKPSKDGEEARRAIESAGLPIFKNFIRRFAAYQKASYSGVPVYKTKDDYRNFAWNDYVAVGEEILNDRKQVRRGVSTTSATVEVGV